MKKIYLYSKQKIILYFCIILTLNINIEKIKAVEITIVNSNPSVSFVDEINSYVSWFLSLFISIYILLILLKLAQYIKSNNKERKTVLKKKLMFYSKIIIFFVIIRYLLIPLFILLIK